MYLGPPICKKLVMGDLSHKFLLWNQSIRISAGEEYFIGIDHVIANLVSVDNTELVFISDFKLPYQVSQIRVTGGQK